MPIPLLGHMPLLPPGRGSAAAQTTSEQPAEEQSGAEQTTAEQPTADKEEMPFPGKLLESELLISP